MTQENFPVDQKSCPGGEKSCRGDKMRELVLAVGGPMRAEENRKRWLDRVARLAGLSPGDVVRAWYGRIKDPEHKIFWKLREAQRQQQREDADAREELARIKARLSILESRLAAQEAHGDSEIDHGAHSEVHRTR